VTAAGYGSGIAGAAEVAYHGEGNHR
jgi:hypothetical protein